VVGLSFFALNVIPGAGLVAVLCMLIATLGEISAMSFMNSFWVSRTNANNRGQYAGLYTMAWSTAQVLGPSLGSQVAGHFSFRTLWWITTSVCCVAALGFKSLSENKMQ
jgi:MFS family permease